MDTVFGGNAFIYPGRNATRFCFKAVDASDEERIVTGFKRLSPQSVYNRFFEHLKELSTEQLKELTHADQRTHVVWGAFDMEDKELSGVGLARYKRETAESNCAEIAITVIDEYQDQGVGTILLGILYTIARKSGIEFFTGITLSTNWRLINRFIKIGATVTRNGSEYRLLIPIYRELTQFPGNPYATLLKGIVRNLDDKDICV